MPGLTVIPGQDPYRGLSQALTMGIQGWDRNQQQQQLAQQLGPNNPLSRLVPFLSPQQMAMLQGQQAIWQQQNPLAGQQAQAQLGLTGAQTQLAQARTAGLQQGGGFTRPQIITQLNKLRDQKIQIEAAVSGGRMSRSSARQKLANITRQEQQLTDLLSGTPQRQQQGGIRGLINSLLGGPQQRQVQPQIELLAPKPKQSVFDKADDLLSFANNQNIALATRQKRWDSAPAEVREAAGGVFPGAKPITEKAKTELAIAKERLAALRDPTNNFYKEAQANIGLATAMSNLGSFDAKSQAQFDEFLQKAQNAIKRAAEAQRVQQVRRRPTGKIQQIQRKSTGKVRPGEDTWEAAARAIGISQNDAYFLINPRGSSAQERKAIKDNISRARELGYSYADILRALNE